MGFLDRLMGRDQPSPDASGTVAKERLKLVLEYDRARLTPAQLQLPFEEVRIAVADGTGTVDLTAGRVTPVVPDLVPPGSTDGRPLSIGIGKLQDLPHG